MKRLRGVYTVKEFCLGIEKLFWGDRWSWWKRLKFEVKWRLGRYRA